MPPLRGHNRRTLESEMTRRISRTKATAEGSERRLRHAAAKTLWRDLGALKEDWVRKEFMRLTKAIGLPEVTAPKTLRQRRRTGLGGTQSMLDAYRRGGGESNGAGRVHRAQRSSGIACWQLNSGLFWGIFM